MRRKYRVSGLTNQATNELVYAASSLPCACNVIAQFAIRWTLESIKLILAVVERVSKFMLSCLCRFPVDEKGTMKSVTDYFRETYGYIIRHPFLPCLQVGNQNRPNYLPMEVCKIVEGQRYSKRLNERQITALLKVTCQRPYEREKDILQVCIPVESSYL